MPPPMMKVDSALCSVAGLELGMGQVANNPPDDVLAKGLSAAFGSDETPAIGNMAAQLFDQ